MHCEHCNTEVIPAMLIVDERFYLDNGYVMSFQRSPRHYCSDSTVEIGVWWQDAEMNGSTTFVVGWQDDEAQRDVVSKIAKLDAPIDIYQANRVLEKLGIFE